MIKYNDNTRIFEFPEKDVLVYSFNDGKIAICISEGALTTAEQISIKLECILGLLKNKGTDFTPEWVRSGGSIYWCFPADTIPLNGVDGTVYLLRNNIVYYLKDHELKVSQKTLESFPLEKRMFYVASKNLTMFEDSTQPVELDVDMLITKINRALANDVYSVALQLSEVYKNIKGKG